MTNTKWKGKQWQIIIPLFPFSRCSVCLIITPHLAYFRAWYTTCTPVAFFSTDRQISLLVREAFVTATMTPSTRSKQFNEHPLVAVPEILAVLLYTTPGLVPAKDELAREKNEERNDFAWDFTKK